MLSGINLNIGGNGSRNELESETIGKNYIS
jgi:hypothetical protein